MSVFLYLLILMKYKQTLATSILFMVRFMSVTVDMTISIVMTMLLMMVTV